MRNNSALDAATLDRDRIFAGRPSATDASGAVGGTRTRLAIISTHPIQYHAHWFRALAARPELDLTVFYCYQATPADQARAGFGVEFDWDIPLLEGYRYRFLKNRGWQQPFGFFAFDTPEIKWILAQDRHDAVLVNGWNYKSAWQAIFAGWKSRIPVMVRGDSQLPSPRGALKRFLKYPAYRILIPKMDACLAVGSRSRDYYVHYGAQPDRIFCVPHVVPDHFARAAGQIELRRSSLRSQWGFEDQHVVFLFAGKFIEMKRPMDFLRAVEAAARQEPRVAGLMVGDGPLRAACEEVVSSRKLPVHFTGFLNQSQIVDAYVAADCLVLTSDGRETWGLVVNEAMSCSRPAVVSDAAGCAPDLVRDGRSGAVFPLGDVEALSHILAALARDPARVRGMGECARAGLQAYSLHVAVQVVVDAIEAITMNRRTK